MSNVIKSSLFASLAITSICVVLTSALSAQRDMSDRSLTEKDSSSIAPEEIEDTLKMTWFTTENIHGQQIFTDTSLEFNAIQYNPLRTKEMPYLFLGTPGSSSTSIYQFRELQSGMDFGFHQFDPYKLHLKRLRWYKTNLPFADLCFSPGKSENELFTSAKFTMNLSDQWNLNLDYQRLLDEGFYKEQTTKNSSLIAGLWHQSKNGKSNTFVSFLTNIHQEKNNGGITDTSYLSAESFRGNIPIILSGSISRHQNEKFTAQHIYYPWKINGADSLKRLIDLSFNSMLSYEKGFFKYYVEKAGTEADSLIYRYLIIDPIGVRNYIDYHKLSLLPGINLNVADFFMLKAGISYDFYAIGQNELTTDYKHDLTTSLKAEYKFKKYLDLNADFDYHFLDFEGDLTLDLKGSFKLDPYVQVTGSQKIVYAHPSWIHNSFILNDVSIYQNSFDPQKQFSSSIGFRIPLINAGFSIADHTYENYIYYTKEKHFIQSPINLRYTQMSIDLGLKFMGFHLDNTLHLFRSDNELYDLPEYRLESSIYYKAYILKKKMELFTGFESFITDKFYIPDYQPVLGAFTTKSDFYSDWHTLINFFISFKVKNFRFFARTENIFSLIDNQVHFQTKAYPLDDFRAFRMGVRWQFVN
ncbi:MAG TPA: hypothetical protein PLU49_05105 [Saprospiraceae bacterium]|nr:hypothetical protein [Saprospiraceae bacterium]